MIKGMHLNKKNAFTLIELLAVIAIMGILAAIVAPNVSNVIKRTKEKRFIMEAKNYISAFKTKVAREGLTGDLYMNVVDLNQEMTNKSGISPFGGNYWGGVFAKVNGKKVNYYIFLSDDQYYVGGYSRPHYTLVEENELKLKKISSYEFISESEYYEQVINFGKVITSKVCQVKEDGKWVTTGTDCQECDAIPDSEGWKNCDDYRERDETKPSHDLTFKIDSELYRIEDNKLVKPEYCFKKGDRLVFQTINEEKKDKTVLNYTDLKNYDFGALDYYYDHYGKFFGANTVTGKFNGSTFFPLVVLNDYCTGKEDDTIVFLSPFETAIEFTNTNRLDDNGAITNSNEITPVNFEEALERLTHPFLSTNNEYTISYIKYNNGISTHSSKNTKVAGIGATQEHARMLTLNDLDIFSEGKEYKSENELFDDLLNWSWKKENDKLTYKKSISTSSLRTTTGRYTYFVFSDEHGSAKIACDKNGYNRDITCPTINNSDYGIWKAGKTDEYHSKYSPLIVYEVTVNQDQRKRLYDYLAIEEE